MEQANKEIVATSKEGLKEIYQVIREPLLERSLLESNSLSLATKMGLCYESYNKLDEAQLIYITSMKETKLDDHITDKKDELELWEERWKYCAISLGQWNSIHEYSVATADALLCAEAYTKLNMWEYPLWFCFFK